MRIAAKLGIHQDHAFGLCFRFWAWCDDNLGNGNAIGVTSVMLDALLDRDGFASALIEVGWLQVRNGSLVVPNYDRHLSENAKKRALSSERTAKSRLRKCNANSVTEALPEKRREEKSIVRKREGEIDFKLDDYPGVTLLQSDNFQEAWLRWESKHRHLRNRSMDFTQRAALLQKLQTNTTGVDDAIALIDYMLAHCDNLHFDGRHRTAIVGIAAVGAVPGGSRPARKTKGQLAMEAMGL
jgi:hypothetical protein